MVIISHLPLYNRLAGGYALFCVVDNSAWLKIFRIVHIKTTFCILNTSILGKGYYSHLDSIELIVIINILDFCDIQQPFRAAPDVYSPERLTSKYNTIIKEVPKSIYSIL